MTEEGNDGVCTHASSERLLKKKKVGVTPIRNDRSGDTGTQANGSLGND